MKEGSSLIRITVLTVFSAGLVIYLSGLIVGFFQASTVYIFYWHTSSSYTFISVFQFEVYPTFVSIISPLPVSFEKLSPLTLIFLVFAVSTIISASLNKLGTTLLLSTSAFLTAIIQLAILTILVGVGSTGFVVILLLEFLSLYSLPLIIWLFSGNLYLIILPIFLFIAGMFVVSKMLLQKKAVLVSPTSISVENLKILKSISNQLLVVIVPFLPFICLLLLPAQLLLTEFPQYPLLIFHIIFFWHPNIVNFHWVYWLVVYPLLLLYLRTYNPLIESLAKALISLLVEKRDKQKPVISILEVKEKLGLESADTRAFKWVLKKATQIGEKEGTIYFGVEGNYFYFKDSLLLIERELGTLGRRIFMI